MRHVYQAGFWTESLHQIKESYRIGFWGQELDFITVIRIIKEKKGGFCKPQSESFRSETVCLSEALLGARQKTEAEIHLEEWHQAYWEEKPVAKTEPENCKLLLTSATAVY